MLVVLVFLFADSFDAPPPPPPLPPPVVAFVVLLPFFNASSFERVAATARLVLRTCVSPVSGSNTKIVPAEWTEGQVDDDEEVDDEEVAEAEEEDAAATAAAAAAANTSSALGVSGKGSSVSVAALNMISPVTAL